MGGVKGCGEVRTAVSTLRDYLTFINIHEIPSLQLGKTLALKFHEYSRIFKRPIPASCFKLIQAVEIPWIFKNIQAHKSWKFLVIPSSIFLQAINLSISLDVRGTFFGVQQQKYV